VFDKNDKCPSIPETIDGNADADGCPEPGAKDNTVLRGTAVTVVSPLRFAPGRATIAPAMAAQIKMIGQRALGEAPIQMIVVQTYADAPGATDKNENLAADRADAIRAILIAMGIPTDNVTAAVGDLTLSRPPSAPQYEITVQKAK
jgi:outer membrane protein OmpA-like peptidoglycan-associated protein